MKSLRILALCAVFCGAGAALWVCSAAAAEPSAREGEGVVFTLSVKTLFPGFPEGGITGFPGGR